jgi:hypothetical protein
MCDLKRRYSITWEIRTEKNNDTHDAHPVGFFRHIGHGSPVVYSIDELSRAVGTRGCDCAMEAQLVYWGATLIPRGVLGGLETVHVLPTSHIRCMCDVLSERGDECCAVTGVSKLSFVCLTDLTIASASSGASMDARYHLGASGIF